MTKIRSPPCAEEAVWCRHQKQQYPTMACCVLPSRCQALPGSVSCVCLGCCVGCKSRPRQKHAGPTQRSKALECFSLLLLLLLLSGAPQGQDVAVQAGVLGAGLTDFGLLEGKDPRGNTHDSG